MLARSVALNVAGSVVTLTVGFVSSLLLSRWLGAADRGLLGVMASFSSIGVGLLGLGLPVAVMYFASRRETRSGALLGNSLLFGTLLLVVLVPLVALLHEPIANALGKGRGGYLWALAAALISLSFLDWTTHNQLLGRLRFGLYNVLLVLSKAATLVCVLVLVVALDGGLPGALVAVGAASVVMVVGSLVPLLRELRPSLDWSLFRRTVAYGGRVQVGTIFQILNYRLDVLILQAFAPLRVVGYYVVAQVVAELVTTLASAFQTSVLPLVAHAEEDERRATTTADALRHHGIAAAAGVVFNAAFGAAVIWWGYGTAFHDALGPMFVLLPAMWFLGTGQVVTGDLRGRGRPGVSSALAGLAVVVTIVLDLVLIPPFGAIGAAIASAAAYTTFGVASLLTIARITGRSAWSLALPTRRDLAAYPLAARTLFARFR